MMTVYLDVVFLWNSISVLLLFFSVRMFYNLKGKAYRLVISAFLGGIYGVLDILYSLWRPLSIVMLFIMTLTAWGMRGVLYNLLRVLFIEGIAVVTIIGLSGLSGIDLMIIDNGIIVVSNDWVIAAVCVVSYPVIIITNKLRENYKKTVSCIFYINGEEIKLKFLYDSGNLLTHKSIPVAVTDWRNFPCINSYEEALVTTHERLIYGTVSSSGIMPLIKPEKAILGGVERDCYIGLTNRSFKGYAGVIGNIDGGGK